MLRHTACLLRTAYRLCILVYVADIRARCALIACLLGQVKPEARTYYELSAATLKFVFPRPGFLEGIKGRSQAITKITNVRLASFSIKAPHHLGSLSAPLCSV